MGSPRCPRPRRRVALLLAAVAPGGRGRLMDGRRPADAALWAGPPAPPAERGGAWAPAPEELEAYMAEASLMATSLAQDAVALSRQARGLQEALREAQQSAPRPHDPAGSLGGATPALPAEALQERGWAEAAEAAEARLAAAQAAGPPRERGWPEVEALPAPARHRVQKSRPSGAFCPPPPRPRNTPSRAMSAGIPMEPQQELMYAAPAEPQRMNIQLFQKLMAGHPVTEDEIHADAAAMGGGAPVVEAAQEAVGAATDAVTGAVGDKKSKKEKKSKGGSKKVKTKSGKKKGCC
ncbi:unnamed protein product [Prorocentrum cordatum]|uniref:Uncharacterized protein n=2 Tax=Prorocentrum cordatum TaxID=2364126 RepID=A0ABN9TRF6_9DINO|nr:unnamed protein product [Polarella glacialis]CAK0848737.1 unnamed protein product [Polarella glacialis]